MSATAQNLHHYVKSNSIALVYAQTGNKFLDQLLFNLFTQTKTVFRGSFMALGLAYSS